MNKLIERIDYLISILDNTKFKDEEKLTYINKFNFDCLNLCKESASDIFMLMYICTNSYSFVDASYIFSTLNKYLSNITCDVYDDLCLLQDFFIDMNESQLIDKYKVPQDNYLKQLDYFNSLNMPYYIRYTFTNFFMQDDKMDFVAYNNFIELGSGDNNLKAYDLSTVLLGIELLKNEMAQYKENKLAKTRKLVRNNLEDVQKELNNFIVDRNNLKDKKLKFDKNIKRKKNILQELKNDIINNKYIDISKLENSIDDKKLLCGLIIYENDFLNSSYDKELENNKYLKENELSTKEKILKQYKFDINPNKILINNEELINILQKINNVIPKIKEYTNITMCIINNICYLDLDRILSLLLNNHITLEFILDNISELSNKTMLDNFFDNINLLLQYNMNIKNVIKYDENILFYSNKNLNNMLNIYSKYLINFSGDYINFEFLKYDLSYIIDKFIEIGEYDLIKNNPSLINKESLNIINRIIVFKNLGNEIVNEQNKLRGSLRKEENFILTNNEINEIVITNYEELMDGMIFDILSSEEIVNVVEVDLTFIDKYLISNIYYDFDGVVISKNKIEKNMNMLLYSDMKDKYSYNELLYYSIIYNYPKLLTEEDICNLKRIVFSNKILMK